MSPIFSFSIFASIFTSSDWTTRFRHMHVTNEIYISEGKTEAKCWGHKLCN